MSGWRRVFVKDNNDSGHWREISIVELRKGNTFIMFEPSGQPVLYKKEAVMIATSSVYLDEESKMFMVESVTEKEYPNWRLNRDKDETIKRKSIQ